MTIASHIVVRAAMISIVKPDFRFYRGIFATGNFEAKGRLKDRTIGEVTLVMGDVQRLRQGEREHG